MLMLLTILASLYMFQESLLYLPDVPHRYNKDNPESYQSPTDRSLYFEDVSLEVENG